MNWCIRTNMGAAKFPTQCLAVPFYFCDTLNTFFMTVGKA